MEANKQIVRDMYSALANREYGRVPTYFSPSYRHHSNGRELTLDETMQTAMLAALAFPDLRSEVLETLAEDDRVMIRLKFSGTHTGEVMGIAPSGRAVSWDTLNVFVVRDGLIVSDTPYWDVGVIFQQLGVDPSTLDF